MISRTPVRAHPIKQMMDLARHRGPDDEGYLIGAGAPAIELFGGASTPRDAFVAGLAFSPSADIDRAANATARVTLGFRRLSILDLSVRGHQPMCTPDRRFWIVFNGEIYNYRELGEELGRLGHRFVSHSDTEVLLAAFAQWGTACFERLNGMWACLIYDTAAGEVIASRDRFGIKPLYYWVAPDGTLCFASEIKQFAGAPGWRAAINVERASEFLAGGLTDHGDQTLFDRVYALGPGQFARVPVVAFERRADGRINVEQWYHLRASPFRGSFEDAAIECRRLLTDSVRLMLRSDVPVGSCLSGGIDSSSIVCLSHQLLSEQGLRDRQRTFSAIAPATPFDERTWIDEVVRATGVESHFTTPDALALESAAIRLAWHQDEPVTSTSVFAQWQVFSLAAATGMKVMLDGQGADEAFAGYHSFFTPYLAGLLRDGQVAATITEFRALKRRHGYSELRALRGLTRILLTGGAWDAGLAALSHAQLTGSNLQMLLRFEDRNSMAHSVESRVPFLDHRVVEFALGLDDGFKLGGGVTKRVLRQAMNGVLPDRVRERVDKVAFETPESEWMRGDHSAWFRSQLERAVATSNRLVPASILIQFDAMVAGTRPVTRLPWRAISLGHWMQAFEVAAPSRAR